MDRRTFFATAGAAAIAGTLPAIANELMPTPEVPIYNYALLMTYSNHNVTPWKNVDAFSIAPHGRMTIDADWTIERAMTDIWPGPGGLVLKDKDSTEYFGLSFPQNGFRMPTTETARDETLVAVIDKDGSVEFGPQFDGDESDRAAWREMGRMFVKLAAE